MFTSKTISEKFTQDVEHRIGDASRVTLIEIVVPTKAKMNVLSIGVYTDSLFSQLVPGNTVWWEIFVDNKLADPIFHYGRIMATVGIPTGRLRQSVHGLVIDGGHTFRIDACNGLVPPEGDGPLPWMGVSLEWEFLYEECEGLDVEVAGSFAGSGLLGKGC